MASTHLNVPDHNLFLLLDDQRHGPFTRDQILEKFQNGAVTRGTYLWFPGLHNWVTLGDIPELDRRQTEVPGPTPGAGAEGTVWVYEGAKRVVSIPAESLKELIREGRFRRADLVYVEPSGQWVRADQHPELMVLFKPAVPPPPQQAPLEQVIAATAPTEPINDPLAPDPEEGPEEPQPGPDFDAPEKKTRSWGTWVFPGVGLASVAIVFAFASGFLDFPALVQHLGFEPATPPSRSTASLTPNSGTMEVPFPLGADRAELRRHSSFGRCTPTAVLPEGERLGCTKLGPGIDSVELTLSNNRLVQVATAFAESPQAPRAFAQLTAPLGAGVESLVDCSKLSESRQKKYARHCQHKTLWLMQWKSPTAQAYGLVVRVTPNEPTGSASLVPLELRVDAVASK